MNLPKWLKSAGRFTMAAVGGGGPTRQDTYLVNVQIEHPTNGSMINYGTWDKMTGGGLSASSTVYRPGGMGAPVSLGGQKTTANVVVSRLYRLGRDHDVVQQIFSSVGKARMVVTKHPLTLEGNAYGSPIVYQGTLERCTAPEVDSEASGAGLIELEMTVEGYPTA